MLQPSTIIVLISVLFGLSLLPSEAAIKGGIDYSIPIDYSKLSIPELEKNANGYFFKAAVGNESKLNENVTNALMLYSVLQKMEPENAEYSIRLGILYDMLNMDRYAKGNFARAISVDKSDGNAYFYFGEYYYKRQQYRKALKYYKGALGKPVNDSAKLYQRLGDVYNKLGDSKSSGLYLKK